MISRKKKKGKKPSFLVYFGREYEGVYVQKRGDKQSYYTLDKNGKQIYLSLDPVKAIHKWQNLQKGELKNRFLEVPTEYQTVGQWIDTDYISKSYIIQTARELFEQDRIGFANEFGYPQLAHLEDIKPLPKAYTLEEIKDNYKIRKDDVKKRTINDAIRYFRKFMSIIGKKTIRDITFDDVKNYRYEIYKLSKSNPKITNRYEWIRANFGGVKQVFNYTMENVEQKKDFITLSGHFKLLKNIRKIVIRPKIVLVKQFQELFENSKNKPFARCILLLGLNCACRYSEISHLKKEDFDFENCYLSFSRPKTGIIQSSYLWPETVEAIKQYMKIKPNESEYIFLTKYKNQYKRDDMDNVFKKIIGEKSKGVTQNLLKKSFETVATDLNCYPNAIDIVMGHSIKGLDNNYNQRSAIATIKACESVQDYYFNT